MSTSYAPAVGCRVFFVLAALITLYGGLLRLDALTAKYGALEHPAWARILTRDVAGLVRRIRPGVSFGREANPYVGGDPINYLKFAREMESFYQGHVREPVFLASTRAALWALDGQDVAVSFASMIGSTAAIFGTCLLGAAAVSPVAGLVAGSLLAIEYEAIIWAPDGWRDDTFTAAVVFAAWALIRLRQSGSTGRAVAAGVLCGLACLTRITALSFVLPALGWMVLDGPAAERRRRARHAGIAAAVAALVIAPYLINCAIRFGDPLIAINYHTTYYRAAEGKPFETPMSAGEYLRARFAERPIAMADTGFNGLFVQPYTTKWNGYGFWADGLGAVLRALGALGLALLPVSGGGRLLIVILLASLAPYVFTWNLGGGGEWRFTMHAYPFYLVGVGSFVSACAAGVRLLAGRRGPAVPARTTAFLAALVLTAAAAGAALYVALPWFVTREALARGDSSSIETGARDRMFYRTGWSPPHEEGITVRVSVGERSVVRLPLPSKAAYEIVVRMDPAPPSAAQRVGVLFNGHFVGNFALSWNPKRVGSYRIRVHEGIVRAGGNTLTLIPERTTAAGSAGSEFAWLEPDAPIGVRLWYVRVIPLTGAA